MGGCQYIGSLKREDQAAFNLFTSYLLEKMGKTAPAELSQLESRIAGYEIESSSVDFKDRGLLDKFKEWYLKRYETILKTFLEKKDAKKLKKDRSQILFCIDLWSSLKWREKKVYKIDPETQQAFNSAWSQAHSDYKYNKKYVEAINGFKKAYGIWAEKAIEQGVNHYIGLCYEELKDYDSSLEAYKQSIYKEINFYSASLSHCKSVCYYLIPQKEQYISKKISFFENLFENPTTLVNSAEDFKFQCLRTIGSIYSLLEEDNIIKEKYLLESIKFYIRVRGQFSNLDNRIEIQSRIYDAYNRINRFYGSGKRKKEYYLEMIKNEEYSVSNALFYSPDEPYRSMARIFYDLADECILTRTEKTLYYNESVRTAGEAADKISVENASDIVNLFFDLDTYFAFSNAFGYADSIESKYNAGQKYLAVIEKQEKRLPSGDSKTDLISRQIYAISDLITNLSMCSKEKPEELYLKLCSMIQYASSYTDVGKYAYSEMSGYFYAGVNMSQGEAATNSEYLEKAAQKAQQIINGEFSEGTKKDAKKKLLEILFYSRKYDSLIRECTAMLGSNTLGVEDGFLYQLTGKCYFEKSLSVTGDEAVNYRKSAQENYNKAATGSGHYELGIDQALLLSQQGNSKEAFKKIKEFISQTGPEDQIPTRLYKYIMLGKEMLKIGFTPDILDLGENDTQIYTATIAFADGTTAETTAGASGWKWSAEGNGTIVEQNGNVMKYKAGKDSSSDIITAECNVDLKQVLKIRGDFDAIVEIKGELSIPLCFVNSKGKRIKTIPVFTPQTGIGNGPFPKLHDKVGLSVLLTSSYSTATKDKIKVRYEAMEPSNNTKSGTSEIDVMKIFDLWETTPDSGIFVNDTEECQIKIVSPIQQSIPAKGKKGDNMMAVAFKNRVYENEMIDMKFFQNDNTDEKPYFASNITYTKDEEGNLPADTSINAPINAQWKIRVFQKNSKRDEIKIKLKAGNNNGIEVICKKTGENTFESYDLFVTTIDYDPLVFQGNFPEHYIKLDPYETDILIEAYLPGIFYTFAPIVKRAYLTNGFSGFFSFWGNYIEDLKKILVKNLGYQGKTEFSLQKNEFIKEINECSIFYFTGHGDFRKADTGLVYKFLGMLVNQTVEEKQKREEIDLNPLIYAKEIPDANYHKKMVFLDCCWSGLRLPKDELANASVLEFVSKFNAKIYIGWNGELTPSSGERIAKNFFALLNEYIPKTNPRRKYTATTAIIKAVRNEYNFPDDESALKLVTIIGNDIIIDIDENN